MSSDLSLPLAGTVALMAGATRGAGRGIAVQLGAAGATVYCTGRTTRNKVSEYGRTTETIEETAELVTAAGGKGIAVQVDHLEPDQVRALVERIGAEQGRLDILVNDVWGGEKLFEWNKSVWEHDLENGLLAIELGQIPLLPIEPLTAARTGIRPGRSAHDLVVHQEIHARFIRVTAAADEESEVTPLDLERR